MRFVEILLLICIVLMVRSHFVLSTIQSIQKVTLIDRGSYDLVPSDLGDDVIKIMCISDTHNIWTQHVDINSLPDVDILVHAGDFSMIGDLKELRDFAEWMHDYLNVHHKAKHAVIIGGNHDLTLHETYYNEMGYKNKYVKHKQIPADCKQQILEIENCIYLQDEAVVIDGVRLFGSPWIPYIGNWAFSKQRGEELERHWNETLDADQHHVDVLVTHGPPHGVGDVVAIYGENKNVGDQALWEKVKQRQPSYHIFGHIHEGHGMYRVEDIHTTFINAVVLDEKYKAVYKPIVFELPANRRGPEKKEDL